MDYRFYSNKSNYEIRIDQIRNGLEGLNDTTIINLVAQGTLVLGIVVVLIFVISYRNFFVKERKKMKITYVIYLKNQIKNLKKNRLKQHNLEKSFEIINEIIQEPK